MADIVEQLRDFFADIQDSSYLGPGASVLMARKLMTILAESGHIVIVKELDMPPLAPTPRRG